MKTDRNNSWLHPFALFSAAFSLPCKSEFWLEFFAIYSFTKLFSNNCWVIYNLCFLVKTFVLAFCYKTFLQKQDTTLNLINKTQSNSKFNKFFHSLCNGTIQEDIIYLVLTMNESNCICSAIALGGWDIKPNVLCFVHLLSSMFITLHYNIHFYEVL